MIENIIRFKTLSPNAVNGIEVHDHIRDSLINIGPDLDRPRLVVSLWDDSEDVLCFGTHGFPTPSATPRCRCPRSGLPYSAPRLSPCSGRGRHRGWIAVGQIGRAS